MADKKKDKKKKLIDRDKRIAELKEQILICEANMQVNPDPTAKSRVDALVKNPCLSGMFYLNAIFKEDQEASEEEKIAAAKKERTITTVEYKYSDSKQPISVFYIEDNGFFMKDDALELQYNSFNEIDTLITNLNSGARPGISKKGKKTLNEDFHIYVDIKKFLKDYGNSMVDESNNFGGQDDENFNELALFDSYLDGIYGNFYEDTLKIMYKLSNPNVLTNGVKGVPRCKKLFNYGKFKSFCDDMKKKISDTGDQLGNASFLTSLVMKFVIGPEKIEDLKTNFKNLKKNEFKPNLDIEIKKLEEDVENGGKCPKYFKEYIAFPAALSNAIQKITLDEYIGTIKSTYIGKGGIWIITDEETDAADRNCNCFYAYSTRFKI